MKRNARRWLRRATFGVLATLALGALAIPSAEARARVSIRSVVEPRPAASVSRPNVPLPALAAAKPQVEAPSARSVSAPLASVAPDNRGFLRRTWDWLLGRRPAPQPAPRVAQATPAPAPAAAPAAPASRNIVVPVSSVSPATRTASPAAPAAAQPQGQDVQRTAAPGGPSAQAKTAAAAASGAGMAEAVNQAFGTRGAEAGQRGAARSPAFSPGAEKPAPIPSGYVLHLTNGRRIFVASYEEKGDQVMIAQRQGSYGIPKSQIARIETKMAEPELFTLGGGAR